MKRNYSKPRTNILMVCGHTALLQAALGSPSNPQKRGDPGAGRAKGCEADDPFEEADDTLGLWGEEKY
ncbi:MAG: hypothetical protein PUD15_06305 [Prevotella sp.]|nr:hypothetical protein [Prevotella sp.]